MFPRTRIRKYKNAGTTVHAAGFVKKLAVGSFELQRACNAALWRIFFIGQPNLKQNQHSCRLPTSKAIGNWIDLGTKRYRILNYIKKSRLKFKKSKTYRGECPSLSISNGRSTLAGRFLLQEYYLLGQFWGWHSGSRISHSRYTTLPYMVFDNFDSTNYSITSTKK